MSFKSLINRMQLSPRDAEVIFDRNEPVGQPTDLVLPVRKWFGKKSRQQAPATIRSARAQNSASGS